MLNTLIWYYFRTKMRSNSVWYTSRQAVSLCILHLERHSKGCWHYHLVCICHKSVEFCMFFFIMTKESTWKQRIYLVHNRMFLCFYSWKILINTLHLNKHTQVLSVDRLLQLVKSFSYMKDLCWRYDMEINNAITRDEIL